MDVLSNLKFEDGAKIEGLPTAIAYNQPITLGQILAVKPDFFPPETELLSTVTSSFPAVTAEHANAIAIAARWAALDTSLSLSGTQIVGLLGRSGNLIYDFRNSYGLQFQDASETQPVTADGQNLMVIRPWKGTNKFTADTAFTVPTASKTLGAFFAQSKSYLRLQSGLTDVRFAMTALKSDAPPSGVTNFIWGDNVAYDYSIPNLGSLFDTLYANPFVLNGEIFFNGAITPNTQLAPNPSGLIAVRTTGVTNISSIADDRGYIEVFGRSFFGRRIFDLLSSEIYTLDEAKALNRFGLQYAGLA